MIIAAHSVKVGIKNTAPTGVKEEKVVTVFTLV